ncbi:transcription factor GTE9-like [Iris pallida]|uniref:Transcription factor GTE9-like n=1 Tax=Iris pallida TaxID=29817 RepID=A0AAX6E8D6_IRIPA|nr:transcription factor GTE9-like [Iris pallida]
MEKTVEINENSLFMKDLEMLKTAPGDFISELPEMSPGQFQESMADFSLGGSNLLEQLGLFMKNDEEEEEEGNPSSVKTNDVEEGEID